MYTLRKQSEILYLELEVYALIKTSKWSATGGFILFEIRRQERRPFF